MYSFSRYKEQYRANLKLALPVVLSQAGQILVQFADNAMVGHFGGNDPLPLAAVAFGGSVFFILFITGMGLTMGLTPLVGECFARGDRRGATEYFKNGIIFYTVLGFLIAAVQLAIIPLMYHMGQPEEVVDMAIPYYRLMAYGMPAVMLFFAFKQFLEGIGNTVVAMVIVLACNLMNVGLNWVFIFGHCGVDAMGATGAGVATLISRIAMPLAAFWYLFRRNRLREYAAMLPEVRYSRRSIRQLVRMGVPISGQMFLESSAFVFTSIMMGWFNAVAIGANQISMTMGNFAFMIVTAVGAATTIRISHCYGARRFEELGVAAKAALHIIMTWNLFAALVFVSLRSVIPQLFTTNPEVIALASQMLVLIALYQLSDGIQNISVGVLRGVQDVKIIMPLALAAYWLLNLPVGYLCGFVLGLGPWGLYIGYFVGLTTAAVLYLVRIRRDLRRLRNNAPAA
ncbi:MATE family efflux transporter [uncultured Alistipes sp.]|uniref:MATE family efflux transporter n=1 Tax=uncultured Alistipes sp. TaxID=538949 RepID=UPI002605D824|nr:MATE family efflux transporter [uncultured Alistipes sp.]